jgi:myosin heavy subunit
LIDKINKCKAYFIRCIKPNPNQEQSFINEFVVKQLRYCSIMHVCKIRKCGFPYRIKFEDFLKWYKSIEIFVTADKATSKYDSSPLQKCIKCVEFAKITDYRVGRSKLFLRYWHIDIFNLLAKKIENCALVIQKTVRGWITRNLIKQRQQSTFEIFKQNVEFSAEEFFTKLTKQNDVNKAEQQHIYIANNNLYDNVKPADVWPDLNEITSTLDDFDTMLQEYDDNEKMNNCLEGSNLYNPIHKTSKVINNTLKKRNALVAFEFKTILNQVLPQKKHQNHSNIANEKERISNNYDDEEIIKRLNNEVSSIFPPSIPNNKIENLIIDGSSSNSSTLSSGSSVSASSVSVSVSSKRQQFERNSDHDSLIDKRRLLSPSQIKQKNISPPPPSSTNKLIINTANNKQRQKDLIEQFEQSPNENHIFKFSLADIDKNNNISNIKRENKTKIVNSSVS